MLSFTNLFCLHFIYSLHIQISFYNEIHPKIKFFDIYKISIKKIHSTFNNFPNFLRMKKINKCNKLIVTFTAVVFTL